MRTSWKGAISFGLVTVPVALAPAVEEHNISLHQVHVADGGRVRMKRWCELEDREVPYREIGKGYEADDEHTVVLTDEDLADLPVPTKKTIDVLAFVDEAQIDPVYFAKPYYIAPDKAGAKPYALLRDAMRESGQVAVTKITLSTRESPAVLRVHDDVLMLHVMVWPDEVRSASVIAPQAADVRPQELAMARSLIDTLSADFPDLAGQLHDDYQDALRDLVEAKLDGAPAPHQVPGRPAGENVVDLMAVLERSVKAAKTRGGAPEAQADSPASTRTRAKKAAQVPAAETDTSRGAAKKTTAAKKAPAKKTAAAKKAAPARNPRRAS